jgi:K+-sensing histidine kinase KdpD
MKNRLPILSIALWMIAVTTAHLLVPHQKFYVHEIIRFFYVVPIVLAAKSGGKWYGLLASVLSGILYSPHFLFKEAPVGFHVEGAILIALLCVVGYVSGTYSDIKKNYLMLKYEDAAEAKKHENGRVLFYADDTPISINCATWLSNSGLLEKESKLVVLYGPNYAEGSSGEASFLDNKSVSLSQLKGIIKDTGISTEKVEVKFIEPGKQAKLSQKIIELAESLQCSLILIGKHPLSKSQEFLFGDTAINLIRESSIPIAVVPNR